MGFNNNFGPREMHKATCSECKQECEVPFVPTPGKEVFCKECFAKKKAAGFQAKQNNQSNEKLQKAEYPKEEL